MEHKSSSHYILFHKPHGVLSQFTPAASHPSLRDFGPFPKNVYPVGRLDADSEGLLLLTDDNNLKHRLATPKFEHERTYLVQVERIPSEFSLQQLRQGVLIDGRMSKPATARLLLKEPMLPPRPSPIRFRKNVPTSWLEVKITEGRNRQVRRMTASIGHPTLRLVRTHIGFLSLGSLQPGQSRTLAAKEVLCLQDLVGSRS